MITNDYDPRDRKRKTIGDLYWLIVIIIMYIVLVLCCSSCSTPKPVVLERTLHDTTYIDRLRLDSVVRHDSIYFESIVKGDTVYRTKEITRWRDRVSIKHDTIYAVRENVSIFQFRKSGLSLYGFIFLKEYMCWHFWCL